MWWPPCRNLPCDAKTVPTTPLDDYKKHSDKSAIHLPENSRATSRGSKVGRIADLSTTFIVKIIGIDPGTTIIGYGIIETTPKGFACLDYGVFRTPSNTANQDKIVSIYNFFEALIKKHQPDKAGIEKLFFFKNAKTITQVSEIKGVITLALARQGLEVDEFTPLQVKQAVSNYGRADKKQIQKIISLILGLKEIPRPDDAADALAIAICCANTAKWT